MCAICAVCKSGIGPTKCEICGFSDNGIINRNFDNIKDANHWLKTVVNPYREIFNSQIIKKEQIIITTLKNKKINTSSKSSLLKRQAEERKEKDCMIKNTGAGKNPPSYRGLSEVYDRCQKILGNLDSSKFEKSRTRKAIMALSKDSILRKTYEAEINEENKKNENDLHTSPSQLIVSKPVATNNEMIQKKM